MNDFLSVDVELTLDDLLDEDYWIDKDARKCLVKVQAELERLRGIEKAIRSIARGVDDKPEVDFRHMATLWHDIGWPFRARVCSAIADALEAKP